MSRCESLRIFINSQFEAVQDCHYVSSRDPLSDVTRNAVLEQPGGNLLGTGLTE